MLDPPKMRLLKSALLKHGLIRAGNEPEDNIGRRETDAKTLI
jgi:hypothetical protein